MNPNHKNEIVDMIRGINNGHGGAKVEWLKPLIEKKQGYKDAGRELRRLKDSVEKNDGKGHLIAWNGLYYTKKSQRAQGIGRWV